MTIWCNKYKINVNTEHECNCPICIFWKKIKDSEEYKCIYDTWKPGLKIGKDTSNEELKNGD